MHDEVECNEIFVWYKGLRAHTKSKDFAFKLTTHADVHVVTTR